MSKILTQRTKAVKPRELVKPEIHTEEHKTTVVDTRYEPLINLVVHVEGYPWRVNYYSQVINGSDSVVGQQPDKSPLYQQYHFIQELLLKVNSPLSQSQDNESKSIQVTGSANVYPPFIPNVGDMFVADIGDGKPAIFEVTSSERKSIFKEATYQIDYLMTGYAKGYRIDDLEDKVVKRSVFVMDFLEHGQNPVVQNETWLLWKDLRDEHVKLAKRYFKRHYSSEYRCMVLPEEDEVVYDPYLTQAIARWYSAKLYPELIHLRLQWIGDIPALAQSSVFDAVSQVDGVLLEDCFTRVAKMSRSMFTREPRLNGFRYSGMDFCICPVDGPYRSDIERDHGFKRSESTAFVVPESELYEVLDGMPLIHPVDLGVSYIFSEAFYEQDTHHLSHLEAQLLNYLEGRSLDAKKLLHLARSWKTWRPLDQFYLTPFLLTLMKACARSLS